MIRIGVVVMSSWIALAGVAWADPERDGPGRSDPPSRAGEAADEIEPNVVGYSDYRDPLIAINRAIFSFNDVTYRYALIPLSNGYIRGVPEPARRAVGRFFDNLRTPLYAVHHLLQLQPRKSARSLSRFAVNSTIGVAGLWDPALDWLELERAENGFDQTLAFYGAGYGIYLVVPFAGPSDARSFAATLVDYFLTPIPYLLDQPASSAVAGVGYFQEYAPSADEYEILRRKSEDPYLFFRNMHLQGIQRDAEY